MENEPAPLLVDLFDFLDGLCIGHHVADKQRFQLAERCWQAMSEEDRTLYLERHPKMA